MKRGAILTLDSSIAAVIGILFVSASLGALFLTERQTFSQRALYSHGSDVVFALWDEGSFELSSPLLESRIIEVSDHPMALIVTYSGGGNVTIGTPNEDAIAGSVYISQGGSFANVRYFVWQR